MKIHATTCDWIVERNQREARYITIRYGSEIALLIRERANALGR